MVKQVTVKDINSQVFVKAYAAHLKESGEMTSPKYVDRRRTSAKQYSVYDNDLYFIKAGNYNKSFFFHNI